MLMRAIIKSVMEEFVAIKMLDVKNHGDILARKFWTTTCGTHTDCS